MATGTTPPTQPNAKPPPPGGGAPGGGPGGAFITGIAGIVSSAISAKAAKEAQARQQKFNAEQAQYSRDFQYEQSTTAYQRATADMRSAGLNPMMMYSSGGQGNQTSSAAQAASSSAPVPDMSGIARGTASAVQTIQEGKRIKALQQQTNSNVALNKEKQITEKTQQVKNKMSMGPIVKGYESLKYLQKEARKKEIKIKGKFIQDYKAGKAYYKKWHGKKVPISTKPKG